MTTVAILREAAKCIGITPNVVTDSGVENVNGHVDALIEERTISALGAGIGLTVPSPARCPALYVDAVVFVSSNWP